MTLLTWPLLGLLIGIAAAQRKGFNMLAGAIGGLLLGPLAILLFLVSGVTKGDERRRCPHCAEWIQRAASVCPHCRRDVPRPMAAAARDA